MVARIYPTLDLKAGETPTSLLSRLARQHRAGTARMFASDLGLSYKGIVDGDVDELASLAKLAGIDDTVLARNAIAVEETYWRLRTQLLLKSSMQRTSVRLCRACIAADIDGQARPDLAAYGRATWQIVSLRTCPIHNMPIVEVIEPPQAQMSHDFARLVGPVAAEIARLVDSEPARFPTDFERYLHDRLDGRTDNSAPWLNSLQFAAVAKLCEVVGAVHIRGRKARLGKMTDADWHAAGAAGFDILRGGEAALRAFLTELDATFPYSRQGNEGGQAIFGDLFKWLAFQGPDKIFDPIRDIVRRHIVETLPVAAGDTILGQTVEHRKIHSIYSASLEYDIHPKRLRKVLDAQGLVPPDLRDANNNRTRFSAEAAAAAIDDELDAIPLKTARDYLNADRVHTQLIADAGFIKPTDGFADGNRARYTKRGLDSFLARLIDGADVVATAPDGAFTIPAAGKRANCSAVEILNLIFDKKLAWTGKLAGERGYLSVLVDLDEIKRFTHGEAVDGLTAHEVQLRWQTTHRVIRALIKNGHLTQETVINPVNRCPTKIIGREQVERFETTFVTLHGYSAEVGRHFRVVKADLAAAGIAPALDPATYHATFYRRAEVDAVLVRTVRKPGARSNL